MFQSHGAHLADDEESDAWVAKTLDIQGPKIQAVQHEQVARSPVM